MPATCVISYSTGAVLMPLKHDRRIDPTAISGIIIYIANTEHYINDLTSGTWSSDITVATIDSATGFLTRAYSGTATFLSQCGIDQDVVFTNHSRPLLQQYQDNNRMPGT